MIHKKHWMVLSKHLLGESQADIRGLLFPWFQTDLVISSRARLILSRVRMVAAVFAVFTPMWIFLDMLVFPTTIWEPLAIARMVTSSGFAILPFLYRESDKLKDAYIAIVMLFAIPTLFFIYASFLFVTFDFQLKGIITGFLTIYMFLPFVLISSLSVFPLTALEGAVFMIPALLLEFFIGASGPGLVSPDVQLGLLWLMFLLGTVATFSSISQLHYLTEIILKSAHDPLTGAFNRSTGKELLEKYFILAKRNKSSLIVLFFDLDHFKSVNDDYGHEAGDKVLQEASKILLDTIRKIDLFVRWGGEEFLLVLPQCAASDSKKIIQRLCDAGLGKRPDGNPITASIGMAQFLKDKPKTLEHFIELADQRMYKAKEGGRNQICLGDKPSDMIPFIQ